MTSTNSAEGEPEPSGPPSSHPDATPHDDVTSHDDDSSHDGTTSHDDTDSHEGTAAPENDGAKKDAPTPDATGSADTGASATSGKSTAKLTKTSSRRRAATMKPPPTLLGDFLLGRPSPARIAADKKAARELAKRRRMSLEAVKHEMRQASVQRIQAPGGVRDRVTKWQKQNAMAMARADAQAPPSEPTEVLAPDDESVTEEDRVRIKMRQKKRPPLNVVPVKPSAVVNESNKEVQKKVVSASPPKKRVVSDTNWVKNHGLKSPPTNSTPKSKVPAANGPPLTRDFLTRHGPNPPVAKKIQEWASRVEIPSHAMKYHKPQAASDKSADSCDGTPVKPTLRETPSESDIATSRPRTARGTPEPEVEKSRPVDDDGIRVKPQDLDEEQKNDTKLKSKSSTIPDDGIRVKPIPSGSRDSSTVRSPSSTRLAKRRSVSPKNAPRHRVSLARKENRKERESRDLESNELKTPRNTSLPTNVATKSSNVRPRRHKSMGDGLVSMAEDGSVGDSRTSGSGEVESEIPSVIQKPLADIPFGSSAFSELELPRGVARRPTMRAKPEKQSTLKDATNALKKALTEGKKILTEKVDPPRPVVNQPPSIENWLQATIDPGVEDREDRNDEIRPISGEKEKVPERERIPERRIHPSTSSLRRRSADSDEDEYPRKSSAQRPVSKTSHDGLHDESVPSSPGDLKRTRTGRVPSSAEMNAGKRNFKEKIRDAFRGESAAVYSSSRSEYSSYDIGIDGESEHTVEHHQHRRRSSTMKSAPSDDESSLMSAESTTPKSRRRATPSSGFRDLTAPMTSAEMLSMLHSELSSNISEAALSESGTTPRTYGLTRSTAISRKRSQKSDLKRRLTKHSDLVSVLSLPEDTTAPSRNRSLRSAHSVRRASNRPDATIQSLLRELARDEDLYSRELKTLIGGVIPVLLSECVNNEAASGDHLGAPSGSHKADPLSKAVVSMGVVLEKLKNHHRRCPLEDAHQLPQWLEAAVPIYGQYLDVWRLGFDDLVVRLAPATYDDDHSLVNGLPRNEQGDLLNERGDLIHVAHLLQRPLTRTKRISRFLVAYRAALGTTQYDSLVSRWELLNEKTHKRHREEVARTVDDNARNTDTSRTRDLRTMAAAENVRIDRFRQVVAKDTFSLDLHHSNGQRLNCQVEVVYRDNKLFKSDPGDLLIIKIGSGGRPFLLFAPVAGNYVSARRGDDKFQLVVMIRGYDNEWSELVTLTADSDGQVLDWLEMLGSNPMPPEVHKLAPFKTGRESAMSSWDPPLGEPKRHSQQASTSAPTRTHDFREEAKATHHQSYVDSPNRQSQTIPSLEVTSAGNYSNEPRRGISTSSKHTHRQDSHAYGERAYPDSSIPDEAQSDEYSPRTDGAPAPPMHRSADARASTLAPPAELYSRGKRQSSSPLKHEYHPSDVSSESSLSGSESENEGSYSEYESSDDELEAVDLPDAVPAISIKHHHESHPDRTGSKSSRGRVSSPLDAREMTPTTNGRPADYMFKSLASISYWDEKRGCWKDLWADICSIVTTPGLIEAYPYRRGATSAGEPNHDEERPLIALDLTPLVMLRTSTALDIEIRSPVLSYARLYPKVKKIGTSIFRFRAPSRQECESQYTALHRARLDNAKYKALEEETRVRSFGQGQLEPYDGDGSSQRRGLFGRRTSYRASARAPSQSAGSASQSSVSASSFLKKLMGGANQFNIAKSSIHRQSRFSNGENSTYASSSSGLPRSPSVSASHSGSPARNLTTNNLKIRLHLMVSSTKWEDCGNCYLEVTRPDQGTRQDLRKYQGMEKRIIVTTIPKKSSDKSTVVLDVVLGSRCFSRLGSRGVLLNVWEEVRDEHGEMGVAPKGGGSGGNVNKWCFQCASVVEASWIYSLVTQEVFIS